ncbi:hypothetical protein CC99x_008460 [Candidatus Berkiella cookevillensis]|uniref:Uncharacterized protein n=1 Tax=Candidatus Berkiella cookevillensis TaxID=437022 RepID=A0A0Q9YFN0_9GAMM|nr:DNA2/NAM7 family helicase [Candidatus Berkiella cookevillensis]MCS5708931.1 hypothetical protein [Candidatus Berkiella cookevillensis]
MQAGSHEEDCEILTDKKDSLDLLQYWQMFAWREPFKQLPLNQNAIPKHHILSQEAFKKGACADFPDGDYWVAPFWQDKEEIWLPIWLPIRVLDKQIVLRSSPSLPWIPSSLFLPSSKIYLRPQALYDDFLKHECVNKEGGYCFKTVEAFLKASMKLLKNLLNTEISSLLKTIDPVSQDSWIIISHADLDGNFENITRLKEENILLKQYCQLDNDFSKEPISQENYLNIAHFHQAHIPNTKIHSADYYYTLLGLLSLKKGMMQAVVAPKGVPFDAFMHDYVANIFSLHALSKSSRPTIALLSNDQIVEPMTHLLAMDDMNTIEAFLEKCTQYFNIAEINTLDIAQEYIYSKITKTYEVILKTISLSRNYYILREKNEKEYGEVNAFLEQLMNEDENIDEKRSLYIEIQNQWHEKLKSQTFVQRCVGWLSFVKQHRRKKASEYLQKALSNEPIHSPYEQQLVEKIRQLKVIQAKNDQRRIQAVEFLNQYQKAEQLWHKWISDLGYADECHSLSMNTLNFALQNLRTTMWQLTVLYWQGQALQSTSEFKPNTDAIEYLLIQDAEQLSAVSVLPALSRAQRAIFFGDPLGQLNAGVISAQEDEFVLENIYQASDALLEKMQILGLNISYGSAFDVAANNSKYHCGRASSRKACLQLGEISEKNKTIFDYWNEKYFKNTMMLANRSQAIDKDIPVAFIDISRQKKKAIAQNQHSNPEEAYAIEALFKRYPEITKQCVVITPFYKQYQLLSLVLSSFPVTVCHFSNMPSYMSEYVIFSPVYQMKDSRPFVFDEGRGYFYKLLTLVQKKLWIVGDKRIFQKHMHSASGDFAKWIAAQPQEEISEAHSLESNFVI